VLPDINKCDLPLVAASPEAGTSGAVPFVLTRFQMFVSMETVVKMAVSVLVEVTLIVGRP